MTCDLCGTTKDVQELANKAHICPECREGLAEVEEGPACPNCGERGSPIEVSVPEWQGDEAHGGMVSSIETVCSLCIGGEDYGNRS